MKTEDYIAGRVSEKCSKLKPKKYVFSTSWFFVIPKQQQNNTNEQINAVTFKYLTWKANQNTSNDTHPKPVLPRVSTLLIAAARPERELSTRSFCPSSWSQICNFLCGYSSACNTVALSPLPADNVLVFRFESKMRQNCHVKPNRSCWLGFLCVCVWVWRRDCRSLIEGGASRPEPAFKTFLRRPHAEKEWPGKTLCIGSCWLLPIPTGFFTNLLYTQLSLGVHVWPLKAHFYPGQSLNIFRLLSSSLGWISENVFHTSSNQTSSIFFLKHTAWQN